MPRSPARAHRADPQLYAGAERAAGRRWAPRGFWTRPVPTAPSRCRPPLPRGGEGRGERSPRASAVEPAAFVATWLCEFLRSRGCLRAGVSRSCAFFLRPREGTPAAVSYTNTIALYCVLFALVLPLFRNNLRQLYHFLINRLIQQTVGSD